MILGMSGAATSYLRPAPSTPKTTLTLPGTESPAGVKSGPAEKPGIPVSQLTPLTPGPMIQADQATLDRWASGWLAAHNAAATPFASDDAPQNTYAHVKVGGKVVATLYNGGSSTMTSAAAATIGSLKDPEGLSGPNLAQWRAEAYAKALGGTVAMADTAKTQAEWTPHRDRDTNYSRAQLNQGLAGYFADNQKLMAQHHGSWSPTTPSTNFSA
jgi:hypothetical protein